MPAIGEITLSHFRSHKLSTVHPGSASVVLYGPNGAGKTNILEAISMLSPGRGLRRVAASDLTRQPQDVGWKVSAKIADHEIETWLENSNGRQVRIDGKPAPQVALGRIFAVLWLVPAMDRLWTEGADGRRRFLDRIALSFDAFHAEAALTYEKAMRERNRLLKDQVRDPSWYAALETQMAQSGAALDAGRRQALGHISDAQDAAATSFPTAALEIVGPDGNAAEPWAGERLASALEQSRPADLAAGRSLQGPHRADLKAAFTAKGIAARDASTGEQKALLISLVLANARALIGLTDTGPVLLLDEVAAHLDQSRRAALYEEIQSLGVQAWMTGTGPELFQELEGKAQFVNVRESGGLSVVEGEDGR